MALGGRLFKTRSAAAAACNGGHVKIDGVAVKVGDPISAQTGEICRSGKVLGLLEQRVGVKLVSQYFEDQTPASELERLTESEVAPGFHRPKGSGRPTKKERRTLERFWS